MKKCLCCNIPSEEDNNTDFCNENCEFDYMEEITEADNAYGEYE